MKERKRADIDIKRGARVIATVPITPQSTRTFKLMSEDSIKLSFVLDEAMYFAIGDYIDDELFGRFVIKDKQMPVYDNATGGYKYDLTFVAEYMQWANYKCMLTKSNNGVRTRSEMEWYLTATLNDQLVEYIKNLDVLLGEGHGWSYNIDKATAPRAEEVQLMAYNGVDMIAALNQLAQTWECEWWVERKKKVIHFGKCEDTDVPIDGIYQFELGKSVEKMNIQNNADGYANKIYVYGGTDNIPPTYRRSLVCEVKEVTYGQIGTEWSGWRTYKLDKQLDLQKFNAEKKYENTIYPSAIIYATKRPQLADGNYRDSITEIKSSRFSLDKTGNYKLKNVTSSGHIGPNWQWIQDGGEVSLHIKQGFYITQKSNCWQVVCQARLKIDIYDVVGNFVKTISDSGYRVAAAEDYGNSDPFKTGKYYCFEKDISARADDWGELDVHLEAGKYYIKYTVHTFLSTRAWDDTDYYYAAFTDAQVTPEYTVKGINAPFFYSVPYSDVVPGKFTTIQDGEVKEYFCIFNPSRATSTSSEYYYDMCITDNEGNKIEPVGSPTSRSQILKVGDKIVVDDRGNIDIPSAYYTIDTDDPSSVTRIGDRRLRMPLVDDEPLDYVVSILSRPIEPTTEIEGYIYNQYGNRVRREGAKCYQLRTGDQVNQTIYLSFKAPQQQALEAQVPQILFYHEKTGALEVYMGAKNAEYLYAPFEIAEDVTRVYVNTENEEIGFGSGSSLIAHMLGAPKPEQVVEKVVAFNDIYPRCELIVTGITKSYWKDKVEYQDESQVTTWDWTQYTLTLGLWDRATQTIKEFTFDKSYVLASAEQLELKFLTMVDVEKMNYTDKLNEYKANDDGQMKLQGMTFGVEFNQTSQTYTIVRNEDFGTLLPSEALFPSIGDPVYLRGWNVKAMNNLGLIGIAEAELKAKGQEYVNALEESSYTFDCTMMHDWLFDQIPYISLHVQNDPFEDEDENGSKPMKDSNDSPFMVKNKHDAYLLPQEGAKVRIKHSALQNDKVSRIIGYTMKLDKPYDSSQYTVGETEAYSRLKKLEKELTKLG